MPVSIPRHLEMLGDMQVLPEKGHLAALCWENPSNKGAAKSAQIPPQPPAPTPPAGQTPKEIAAKKARKMEKNKRYQIKKKEKREQKKKEDAEAKTAAEANAGRSTPPPLTDSSTEEDSPRKSPMASRIIRVLGDTAKKSLF